MREENQHLETRYTGLIIDTTGSMNNLEENRDAFWTKVKEGIILSSKRDTEMMEQSALNPILVVLGVTRTNKMATK